MPCAISPACLCSHPFFLTRVFFFIFHLTIIQLTATTADQNQPLVLLTSNLTNNREHVEMFNNLVNEYDKRLEEQVKLAKEDMLRELEVQIQVSILLTSRIGVAL